MSNEQIDERSAVDQILDGTLCELCGAWAEVGKDGKPRDTGPGYSRMCNDCNEEN